MTDVDGVTAVFRDRFFLVDIENAFFVFTLPPIFIQLWLAGASRGTYC